MNYTNKTQRFDFDSAVKVEAGVTDGPLGFYEAFVERSAIIEAADLLRVQGDVALRIETDFGDVIVCLHYDLNVSQVRKGYFDGDPTSLNFAKTFLWHVGDQPITGPTLGDYSTLPEEFDTLARSIFHLVLFELFDLCLIGPRVSALCELSEDEVA